MNATTMSALAELRLTCSRPSGLTEQDQAAQLAIYAQRLAEENAGDVLDGCRRWAEENRFWPTLAELRGSIREARTMREARSRPKLPPPDVSALPFDEAGALSTREGQDALRNEVAVPWLMQRRRGKPMTVAELIPQYMGARREMAALTDANPHAGALRDMWYARLAREKALRAAHFLEDRAYA